MKLLIIFNPNAANGRSVKKLADIRASFDGLGIGATFMATRHPGHGTELVANTELSTYTGVVAAGGDGTLFEVLNGLYQKSPSERIPMGVLPIGTGNAFARDLGLQPDAWREAIDLLHCGHTRKIDVAQVRAADRDYYFLNIIGMGFVVDAGVSARKLKVLGNSAYTLATLWRALKLKTFPLVIEIDGKTVHSDNVFVTVSNSRYTGSHFRIAPAALIDDGLLDVTILEGLPRRRLLRLFPTIYKGRHVEHREITTFRASRIKFLTPGDMLLQPDGEFCGHSPAEINCLQRDLSIFCKH